MMTSSSSSDLKLRHQLALTHDPKLLIKDVLFADLNCVFGGFGRCGHNLETPLALTSFLSLLRSRLISSMSARKCPATKEAGLGKVV